MRLKYRNKLSNEVSLIAFLCLALGVTLSVKSAETDSKNVENVDTATRNSQVDTKSTVDIMDFPLSQYLNKERIYELLINSNMPFCKIDGEYYTLNGDKILLYMAKVYASPIEMVITDKNGNKTTYLEPPEGYTLVGNQAIRYVERAVVLQDDMMINNIDKNSIVNIVDSKPYSNLLKNDLTLTLIKR